MEEQGINEEAQKNNLRDADITDFLQDYGSECSENKMREGFLQLK